MTAKTMGRIQTVFALGIVLWWAFFFAVTLHDPHNSPIYLAFETSFPLPDLVWLTPLLVRAARANFRGSQDARIWTAAAGGALVFLGLLDFSFNFQHGIYTQSLADGLINGFINIACVLFGLASVHWSRTAA